MDKKDLESGSDDSDDDYVPEGDVGNVSEEEGSGDAESDSEDNKSEPLKKKRRQVGSDQERETGKPTTNLDIDTVWADFKKDVDEEKKNVTKKEDIKIQDVSKPVSVLSSSVPRKPFISPLANTSRAGGGGISSILGQIGQKNKLSTLEKSKLDWNNFKQAEGIDDELKTHNRGKDGFLEKRDFLERTDLRQFEIEKQLRSVKRSTR